MEISSLGEFKFIERITGGFQSVDSSTIKGVGDDCAVIETGKEYLLHTSDMFVEGINFDVSYFPLRYLGYKCVVAAAADVCAMNGRPRQISVSIAISSRFTVENIEELYSGIKEACEEYSIDLIGGDTNSSTSGLIINISVIGSVSKESISYRGGAKNSDLICVTGDLGAAYMGLKLLEREKIALRGNEGAAPKFDGYKHLLGKELRPTLRTDIIESLAYNNIIPTSMIDLSDGLSSDLIQICTSSDVGARIYLEKIPINSETFGLCDLMNCDPVVAALNGGDDYELMFTVPVTEYENIVRMGSVDVIGHITPKNKGVCLTTPDGAEIDIKAQGWVIE